MHEDCEGIILGIQSVKPQHAFVSTMLKCRMYKSNLSDRPSAAGTPFNEDRICVWFFEFSPVPLETPAGKFVATCISSENQLGQIIVTTRRVAEVVQWHQYWTRPMCRVCRYGNL